MIKLVEIDFLNWMESIRNNIGYLIDKVERRSDELEKENKQLRHRLELAAAEVRRARRVERDNL